MYNADKKRKRLDRPTRGEKALQDAVRKFWDAHYTKPTDTAVRNELVAKFLATAPVDSVALDKPFIVHPATRKKVKQASVTLMEVLGDFIMRPLTSTEKAEEYPVWSQETEVARTKRRKENESHIYFQGWQDGLTEGKEIPRFVVTEDQIPQEEPRIEPPTVEEFRSKLRHVKMFAGHYAADWAEDRGLKQWKVVRKIKRLDLARVRECDVCGGAFYAHDLRMISCDCQPASTSKTLSQCQLDAKKLPDLRTEKTIS
ncbi:hypothetical protein [Shouchella miscanthi]|uniref:Integrase n=1 Tax=Shouchella miscanthi TaxID=2598861 RepID=A0ABU6NH02_9BACI|nr:hypothetical protein [Shouchella miscanthi]